MERYSLKGIARAMPFFCNSTESGADIFRKFQDASKEMMRDSKVQNSSPCGSLNESARIFLRKDGL